MGADIYLESVHNKARADAEPKFRRAVAKRDAYIGNDRDRAETEEGKRLQAEVERHYNAMRPDDGYFRDSYNSTSVLWLIGLSWWSDVIPMLDDKGYLPIVKAKELQSMIKARPITLAMVKRYIVKKENRFADADKVDEWLGYFTEKRERLIAFLERSIQLNEPLACSL